MPQRRKTWSEKLHHSADLPKVVPLNARQSKVWGNGTMAIPSPMEIDGLMKQVPKGRLTTIPHLREAVARIHHADIGCPLTTGIFTVIAAHAAEELAQSHSPEPITPYWRTLKAGGELNPKYPGGLADVAARLSHEGHHFIQKGNRLFVKDFTAKLATL